jgi:hypothetical protein
MSQAVVALSLRPESAALLEQARAALATHDRDAADPAAVALALRAYLRPQIRRDEADIAFEAALLEQGVMAPTEAVEQFEVVADGPEIRGLFIRLDSGAMFVLDRAGCVHVA